MTFKQQVDNLTVYQDDKKLLIDLQATKKKAENFYYELLWFDELKKANVIKLFLTGVNQSIKQGKDFEPAF